MGPLIAGLVIVVVLIAAIGGYVVGGLAYANSRLNNAHTAYNKVVEHQNALTDTVNSAQAKFGSLDASGTTAGSLQTLKTTSTGVVTKAQQAQAQIDSDDASLAGADNSLKENSWLTVLSRSDLDKYSAKIGHERKALATAKTLTTDYVQLYNFYGAVVDVFIDLDTIDSKASAHDLVGAAAASEKMKTDATKAMSLDKAPGLPAEMDGLMKDLQSVATDFSTLINAAVQGNETAFTNAEKALEADAKKVDGFDYNKADSEINSYYNPLIDAYNSEVDKANAG
ncbi:MAG TPA: hypothetical protein VJR46_07920 [Candidatus Dormibacteraeota bacterium]|nr:hypothetical protein [Candidatus Dormibacteraeota bacterium]